MSWIAILPFVLPLLGAGGTIGLSLLRRLRASVRYAELALALIVSGFTAALLLALRQPRLATVIPSLWQPSLLFGTSLVLQLDATMQPLAFALVLATCSAILVEVGRTSEFSGGLLASVLALLSAACVSLWSANVLTMMIGWAIYDLMQTAGRIAAGGSAKAVARGLVLGSLATLLLWAGALLSEESMVTRPWTLMTLSDVQLKFWMAAGILRLWIYPLHLSSPDDLGHAPASAAPLFLGPVVGWGLWLRLASIASGPAPASTWVFILAAVTQALGGFLAWTSEDPRRSLSWIGMGVTGAVLMASLLVGERATFVIVAGATAWTWGMTLLFLSPGWHRQAPWWCIPGLVSALALLGAPLTLGFVVEAPLIGKLVSGGRTWGGLSFFAGQLFLIPALVRLVLLPSSSSLSARLLPRIAHGIGLGLPAILLAAAGVFSPLLVPGFQVASLRALLAMPGLAGWLLWAISLVVGGVLSWQEANLRPKMKLLLGAVHDLLVLEWLYEALVGAAERGLSVLRTADEVVGGAGALLWSFVLFLVLLMIWSL